MEMKKEKILKSKKKSSIFLAIISLIVDFCLFLNFFCVCCFVLFCLDSSTFFSFSLKSKKKRKQNPVKEKSKWEKTNENQHRFLDFLFGKYPDELAKKKIEFV